jgi:L-aminopeptidase/D-esterase-like protein
MQRHEVQECGSGVVAALMAGGRGLSSWRIPVPGRLAVGAGPNPQRSVLRRREAEFRRDLRHFLATRPTGQPVFGGE